jgi:hypothetical protein
MKDESKTPKNLGLSKGKKAGKKPPRKGQDDGRTLFNNSLEKALRGRQQ